MRVTEGEIQIIKQSQKEDEKIGTEDKRGLTKKKTIQKGQQGESEKELVAYSKRKRELVIDIERKREG